MGSAPSSVLLCLLCTLHVLAARRSRPALRGAPSNGASDGGDGAIASFHIFVCFHSELRDDMYAAEGAFDPRLFTFLKVNPALPLRVPRSLRDRAGGTLRILHEDRLVHTRPELQRMGFLESSCQYHVAANGLHTDATLGYQPEYVGFLQYDMRLPPHFVRDVQHLVGSGGAKRKHIAFGDVDSYAFDWAGGPGSHPAGWMLLPFNRRDAWIDSADEQVALALVGATGLGQGGGYAALAARPFGLRGALYNSTLDYFVETFNAVEQGSAGPREPRSSLHHAPACVSGRGGSVAPNGTAWAAPCPAATRARLLNQRRVNLYNAYLLPRQAFERMLRWSSACFFEHPTEFARAVSFSPALATVSDADIRAHGAPGVQWGHLGGMMERAHAAWMALALCDMEHVSMHVSHEAGVHSFSPFHPEVWSTGPLRQWLSHGMSLQWVSSVLVMGFLLARARCRCRGARPDRGAGRQARFAHAQRRMCA